MNENQKEQILKDALAGDINAFQELFAIFQDALKSYLFRLLASRSDADDLLHDTFIRAYDKLHLYRGEASLKTWVFQIATNLAYTHLKRRKRWVPDVSQKAKDLVMENPNLAHSLERVTQSSTHATYTIREHINTCFTCISKTLPIENQVALILKDVYGFSIREMMLILELSEGVVKYLLQNARRTMIDIFTKRCALVSKNGTCHQCSELNGWFNPQQDQQAALMKIEMVKASAKYDREQLYHMRTQLVRHLDPLKSTGNELQEMLLNCNRLAMGEVEGID